MAPSKSKTRQILSAGNKPFQFRSPDEAARKRESQLHVYGPGIVCETDKLGRETPNGRSPLEIVVDASEGFVPLWAEDVHLRWRFQERSLAYFEQPEAAKRAIMELLGEALVAWGDAAPVGFTMRDDAWDFEIAVQPHDNCDLNGCVLARAFFPDSGRHDLVLYPKLFGQSRKEQVETLIHELGHIFGLRHFFAKVRERAWPSYIFGSHSPFSIMNYGPNSILTEDDKGDLKRLYQLAWSGELTDINGTPIEFQRPFHTTRVKYSKNGEHDGSVRMVAQRPAQAQYVNSRM